MGMDKEAFLDAVHSNQGLINKLCHIYRDSKEDREDLFQEIVYQLWKSHPKFRGRSKFTTWMYRIGLNTAMASFRKPKVILSGTDRLPEPTRPEGEENPNRERLFKAIRTLDDAEKAIVSMYLDGFDNSEMAEVMGISKNYLGVRLNRIKNKLRTILNQ
ncbi:RNA polymerase sigma factor [Ulvibacterium sp.]|uniref:RNA polymerase sigma factor n=1 Tax=Ulvibacterium sp. TaxID=2665914 RepID=UPI003BAC4CBB